MSDLNTENWTEPDKPLPASFYINADVTEVARQLLGCRLMTCINGRITGGIIVETEAYDGLRDRASHAFGGKRTPRTEIFYATGGVAYTYLCYGIHTLFNIITGPRDIPHAVLIRAIKPCTGLETVLVRRNHTRLQRNTAGGPGLVSQALGITRFHNGCPVRFTGSPDQDEIWVEKTADTLPLHSDDIVASPRIGIDYAGDDAQLPWRYRIRNSPWNSTVR